MKILGLSAYYHDSAATIIEDGLIIAAAQEERFTRKKHDKDFPVQAVKYCLEESGLRIDDLDSIVFYDKPLLKFERLIETYYQFAPRGFLSFLKAIPVWLREKLFLKKMIKDHLKLVQPYNRRALKLLFSEHHLSHAASTFFPSMFRESAILTIDGVGEWSTASICYGEGNQVKVLKEMHFPHSVGLLYSAFTYYLGFRVNSGEYKLMGLAPYGIPNSERVLHFINLIKEHLVTIYDDGSIWLNQEYFSYATGLKMIHEKNWMRLFGMKRRLPESEIDQEVSDLALAIQTVTEEIVMKMAREAKSLTGSENICLAGGVALNCVANGKLQRSKIFNRIFIQPASGDAGGSLGAALAAHYIYYNKERTLTSPDMMQGSLLGPSYGGAEAIKMLKSYKPVYKEHDSFSELARKTAALIDSGMIVGWFQDKMEFGPRALGNRSILADPRNIEMQKKLNLKIKYRESFRPFAPSVLEEDISKIFNITEPSPYMLLVADIVDELKNNLPENYYDLPARERLYIVRSSLPAITHIDFSARIQSVNRTVNRKYWELINEFKKLSGIGVLVNTSFNVRGEPIVANPTDAYKCFMRTEMDYLVIENYIFDKLEQPEWFEKDLWEKDFVLD